MPRTIPQQAVADIIAHIEQARYHIRDTSLEEFCEDITKQRAVLYDLLCASEAQYRLHTHWPTVSKAFEERYPHIAWKEFRNISNRHRHEYDNVDILLVWEDLSPDGFITKVEAALHDEIPFSAQAPYVPLTERLTTPQQLEVLHRSDVFSQSMRRGVTTVERPEEPFDGKIVWLRDLPDLDMRLALLDVGDRGPYRRIVVDQSHDLSIGNEVAVTPRPDGFELSRKDEPAAQRLRPRMG